MRYRPSALQRAVARVHPITRIAFVIGMAALAAISAGAM